MDMGIDLIDLELDKLDFDEFCKDLDYNMKYGENNNYIWDDLERTTLISDYSSKDDESSV